jgi:predicted kinase
MFRRLNSLAHSAADIHGHVARQVEAGIYDRGIFKCLFVVGGPGSGKSTVFKRIAAHLHIKILNVDTAYELLMRKHDIPLRFNEQTEDEREMSQELRKPAWNLTNKLEDAYVLGHLPIILDGTGAKLRELMADKKRFNEYGYSTGCLFVNTSLEVAKDRNRGRDRALPDEMVERIWNETQANIGHLQQLFTSGPANIPNGFQVIDNSGSKRIEDPLSDEEMKIYKWVSKMLDAKVTNPIALKWISDEMKARKAV